MKKWLPPAVLTAIFVLFRVPVLLNAGLLNSDGAIAGLQARAMLAGEWEWAHWGRHYLTSLDSVVAAPFFAIFGATPQVLLSVTLLAQLTFTWLAYAIVSRRAGAWTALIATLPVAFMTMALNIYLFFDVRQWCVALVLLACWLFDRAPESGRPRVMLVVGLVVSFVALFVDLFAVQFLPGLILFAVLSAHDGTLKLRASLPRFLAVVGGLGLGFFLLQTMRGVAHLNTGRAGLQLSRVTTNWPLLVDQCLPWLIGAKVFALDDMGSIDPAAAPGWFLPVQLAGAIVFGGVLLSGAVLFFVQRIPWRVRVLGAVGAGMGFTSLFGFLGSSTAQDILGARLLLPVIVALPLTLAPLASLAGDPRRFALILSPYLLCTAIGGWLSYGPLVHGATPRGAMTEERALGAALRERGIRYAAADYWIAYRLSFILGEDPIVVPEASEDRYPRWRTEFDAQSRVAYVFHPSSPTPTLESIEARLAEQRLGFEKLVVQGYTVLIVQRTR
ncbi:MAG: glycosyltransferase family 39 protein [Archangium sp.]|nr:glycosyltransferase family 39 protein [Archangium sp.]